MPKLPEVSLMVAVLFTLRGDKETCCEYFEQILFAFLQYQYSKKKLVTLLVTLRGYQYSQKYFWSPHWSPRWEGMWQERQEDNGMSPWPTYEYWPDIHICAFYVFSESAFYLFNEKYKLNGVLSNWMIGVFLIWPPLKRKFVFSRPEARAGVTWKSSSSISTTGLLLTCFHFNRNGGNSQIKVLCWFHFLWWIGKPGSLTGTQKP